LKELDHLLEARHLGYSRRANDFVIVVGAERAVHWMMEGTVRYVEEEFGLTVNQEKSRLALITVITSWDFRSGTTSRSYTLN